MGSLSKVEDYPGLAEKMSSQIASMLDPGHYAQELGLQCYPWQRAILRSNHKRRILNKARQAGGSTIASTLPCWTARFLPGSLTVVAAAVEKQAVEDMEKIKSLSAGDPELVVKRASDELLEFENGSRILVVPATEKSARGYSAPAMILLDEASRIPDPVYASGIMPMLTHNPRCSVVALSTPNGREGFFARAWKSERWERFEVRAPWEVVEESWELIPARSEREYREEREKRGIMAWYSPRHEDAGEQVFNLREMGARMYKQEYLVEFVDAEGQIFAYDDIDALLATQVDPFVTGVDEIQIEALRFDEN
jgi:hypothetical protein